MNKKRMYIWRLAALLAEYKMTMSGDELAAHLNRNSLLTENGTTYAGLRGTYHLVNEVWKWLQHDLGLEDEAKKVALSFVLPSGEYAWESD